jgi:hypothetical protein
MPDKARTVEVEIDGKKVAVQLPDTVLTREEIDEQFVPLTKHNIAMKKLRDAAEGKVDRATLVEDEGFLAELAEKKGDWFAERLKLKKGGVDQSELEKLQQQWGEREARLKSQWVDRELKPVTDKLEIATKTVGSLRSQQLDNTVMQAAVDNEVVEDNYEPIKAWFRSFTKYDEEFNGWFIVGGDGEFEATTVMKKGKAPYKTPGEHLAELRQAGKYASWFKAGTRPGAGYKGPGSKTPDVSVDEQIAAAEKAGKFNEAIKLKMDKARQITSAATR